MTPEDLLAEHTPGVRETADRVRAVLRHAMPEASERVYPGWHAIGLRHPRAGYVCGVFPLADEVRLVFERGVELPDPDGMLEGDGRQVRYLTLRPGSPVDAAVIEDFVAEAVVLPPRRQSQSLRRK